MQQLEKNITKKFITINNRPRGKKIIVFAYISDPKYYKISDDGSTLEGFSKEGLELIQQWDNFEIEQYMKNNPSGERCLFQSEMEPENDFYDYQRPDAIPESYTTLPESYYIYFVLCPCFYDITKAKRNAFLLDNNYIALQLRCVEINLYNCPNLRYIEDGAFKNVGKRNKYFGDILILQQNRKYMVIADDAFENVGKESIIEN